MSYFSSNSNCAHNNSLSDFNDIFPLLDFLCVKCKDIMKSSGSGHHPYPNNAELDVPYFEMQVTLYKVSLSELQSMHMFFP